MPCTVLQHHFGLIDAHTVYMYMSILSKYQPSPTTNSSLVYFKLLSILQSMLFEAKIPCQIICEQDSFCAILLQCDQVMALSVSDAI